MGDYQTESRQGYGPVKMQIRCLSDGSGAWQAPIGTSPRPFRLYMLKITHAREQLALSAG